MHPKPSSAMIYLYVKKELLVLIVDYINDS